MPCGWGVKAGMAEWFVSGWQVKLWDPLLSECFSSALSNNKALYKCPITYYFLFYLSVPGACALWLLFSSAPCINTLTYLLTYLLIVYQPQQATHVTCESQAKFHCRLSHHAILVWSYHVLKINCFPLVVFPLVGTDVRYRSDISPSRHIHVINEWVSVQGLTSHSTYNRSFWRIFLDRQSIFGVKVLRVWCKRGTRQLATYNYHSSDHFSAANCGCVVNSCPSLSAHPTT